MKISKTEILKRLQDANIDNCIFVNLVNFSNEIILDVNISNPTLQAKKKAELEIKESLNSELSSGIKVKINFKKISADKPIKKIESKKISGIKNIIAIASGKGGVGKSTVTSNLSVSLAKMGFKVGLLDADIYGPSIPIMFDIVDERPKSVLVDGKSKMEPVTNYGVKILSIGFFTKPDQAVIWRGPMASKALNQMIFDANWGELDFLVIDLPPGTGDIHLSILQALPITGAVIVSTPQNVALADAKKGVAMFKQELINVPVLGIVENMSYFTPEELPNNKYYLFGKDGAKNLAEDLKVPFLGCIPIEQSVREAGDFGRPVAMQKDTEVSKDLKVITRKIVAEVVKRNKDLPDSEAIKITTMAGCSAVNK